MSSLPNLHLAGRNGMHKYNNQDHSMMTALLVARKIATGGLLDPWKVNADADYHEDNRVGERDLPGRQVPERVPAETYAVLPSAKLATPQPANPRPTKTSRSCQYGDDRPPALLSQTPP